MYQKAAFIKTFGCQMNEHDSEKIMRILEEDDYTVTEDIDKADLILLNTCSIREKAEHKVYSSLGRLKTLKKKNPKLVIGVGGCVAQQEGEKLLNRVPHLDLVFGTHNIHKLPELIAKVDKTGKRITETDMHDSIPSLDAFSLPSEGQIKSYITIMQGCDNYCSYCIVPYVRGREISRKSGEILEEIRRLSNRGIKDITLLGQNVNSYGKGYAKEVTFPELLHAVNKTEGIERIRFTTSHPKDLSEELIYSFRDLNKLCEHIHLPVQSGSDSILRAMNRKYTASYYVKKVKKLRDICPEISITSDIIVGFPGETEKDFEKTLELMEIVKFDSVFSFKYSDRAETRASTLPGKIDDAVKSERLSTLQAYQKTFTLEANKKLVGKDEGVLVEGPSKTDPARLTGRTRSNKVVNFQGSINLIGEIIPVRIRRAFLHSLEGVTAFDTS
ncbi:MAG: tRNA (N6-isopentenyl adenosine(37)-C2)-methylthiotransferase MiaB [Thermodesulfobacteriota bacterium]|nr:tRNA (N6-isopentenyl adenosine(37)-C2)-methylthiotransferase MiaB [Thermodesulfobacteriota bacterium]